METDEYYIPKELVLKMIDDLDIGDIETLFLTNKSVSRSSNDPEVLNYISSKFNLPYFDSFQELLRYVRMSNIDIAVKYYIPLDIVIQLIDQLKLEEIEALFISGKNLSYMSNDPSILRYISDSTVSLIPVRDDVMCITSSKLVFHM